MIKSFLLSFILVGISSISFASTSKFLQLDSYLQYVSSHKRAMGSVSVVQAGQEIYSNNYKFKLQPKEAIYRIGSISKVFTAVMIMKLIENKELSLQTSLSEFYPNFPNAKKITIEHLLRHRSGLVNFTDLPSYMEIFEEEQTEKKLVSLFIKNGSDFEPGEKFSYSNTGYIMLSYILEKIHKKLFAEILSTVISRPLGLKNTFLYEKESPRLNEVESYKKLTKWIEDTNTHQSVPLGAGAVASTARELGVFLWSLFNGKILSPLTVEHMKQMIDGYGLGLYNVPYKGTQGIGHGGAIDGFRSFGFYFEDKDVVVIHLVNANDMELNDTAKAILGTIYNNEFEFPEFEEDVLVPEAGVEIEFKTNVGELKLIQRGQEYLFKR